MRTREEIEEEYQNSNRTLENELIFEVFLDIRDLLHRLCKEQAPEYKIRRISEPGLFPSDELR